MKKLLVSLFIFLGLVSFQFQAKAQNPQFSLSAVGFPDTAHVNQLYSFTFIVTNISPSNTFSGAVEILFRTQNLTGDTGSFGSNQTGGLAPFDTFTVAINNFNFNPNNQPQFRTGDNVVVVWPSIGGNPVGDSLYLHLYIPDPASIDGKQASYASEIQLIRVNNDQLGISITNQQNEVGQVRIYNLAGQEVFSEKNSQVLNLAGIPSGIYIIEVEANEKIFYQKFFKN